jgi:N5-(cytidine 5'-diphosphoramidyl)-L-glutamine hydrolase
MKRIGITQRVEVNNDYDERRDSLDQRWFQLVFDLGFLPMILPNINPSRVGDLVDEYNLDGIILTGGNSLQILEPHNPNVAPERDNFESALISLSLDRKIPTLGVCRGMQIINSYLGGALQKITGHVAVEHELKFTNEGYDFPAVVNSFHEWCIPASGLASDLKPLAYDANGNIEAFEHKSASIFGIMWHPERALPLSTHEINFFGGIFL